MSRANISTMDRFWNIQVSLLPTKQSIRERWQRVNIMPVSYSGVPELKPRPGEWISLVRYFVDFQSQ
jgi:hypothetical protein